MARVTGNDYKKLAEAVSADLMDQQIPLNTSIRKLAEHMDMNHEQIHRLCEAANNVTFNHLFKGKGKDKTASDRIIEFDIADAKKVVGSLVKSASVSESDSINLYEMRPLLSDEDKEFAKVAAVAETPPPSKELTEKDRRTIRKVLSHAQHEKLAAEMEYKDKVAELILSFKKVYNNLPFGDFEKNAVALHGSVPELAAIREAHKLPKVTYDVPKLTKQAGYVDTSAHEYSLLAKAIRLRTQQTKYAKAISKLEGLL